MKARPTGESRSGGRCCRARGAAGIATSALLAAANALAGGPTTDGAYGRLDGDLSFALEAGVVEGFPGELLGGRLSTSYLHTVGLYAGYADALDVGSPELARSTAAGLELRPLFLARFASDLEQGPALLDLWLDSLALALGLYGAATGEHACTGEGLDCWTTGIELGLGMELPLLARAAGPFIAARGSARWPVATTPDASGAVDGVRGVVSLSLGYRLLADSSLVEAGDAR